MKKTVSVILAVFMMLSLAACGEKPVQNTDTDSAVIIMPAQGEPAGAVLDAFSAVVNDGGFSTMEELGNKMNELGTLPMDMGVISVQPGYLNGFSAEIKGFADGAMVAPWIGSVPYICYVFTLEDGMSAVEFTDMLKSSADLRWNICTEADEMAYTAIGNYVCFVMAPASFD